MANANNEITAAEKAGEFKRDLANQLTFKERNGSANAFNLESLLTSVVFHIGAGIAAGFGISKLAKGKIPSLSLIKKIKK